MFQRKHHLGNDSRFWVALGVTAYVLVADQGFKILAFTIGVESWWMTPRLNDQSGWELFSLPAPLMVGVVGAVAAIATFLGWRLVRKGSLSPIGLGLILGGSLGNLLDRFAIGAVRDFVYIPSLGVYNVADFAIAAGCLWWIIQMVIKHYRGAPNPQPSAL